MDKSSEHPLEKVTSPRTSEQTQEAAEQRQAGGYAEMFKSGTMLSSERLRPERLASEAQLAEWVHPVELRELDHSLFANEYNPRSAYRVTPQPMVVDRGNPERDISIDVRSKENPAPLPKDDPYRDNV